MKLLVVFAILAVLTGRTFGPANQSSQVTQPLTMKSKPRPVLVELFTSEGCSTCPPADALLARLEKDQPVEEAEIVAVEEHVDYWNQQGWMDPFSSAEWTLRQQQYTNRFKEKSVYTPQMVVDGQKQFVGNQALEVEAAIREAAQQQKVEVTMNVEQPSSDGNDRVSVRVGKLESDAGGSLELWLAVTETNLESAVKSGENSGRQLRHTAVLRLLRKVGNATGNGETSFTGTAQVKFKSSWRWQNLRFVAFLQDKKTWRIRGLASQPVSPQAKVCEIALKFD